MFLLLTYYSFTTLSTVGFGDYHPQNDLERLIIAFIMFFGVMVFSIMMGTFADVLNMFKSINEPLDEGDNLSKFFNLLQKWNQNKSININLVH